jgi:molybdate transport system substrate-binding protein
MAGHLRSKLGRAALFAWAWLAAASCGQGVAHAAEVKVLASVALEAALHELIPQFEHATGDKVVAVYSLAADLKRRVLDGEAADVLLLTRSAMDELQKAGKLEPGSLVNVAGTAVAVVMRAGAAPPDLSTVEAFKRTLLAAKSIVYADPAKGGASGVYFARVLDQLGLADQLKAKTILVPGAQAAQVVARGDAELGVAQSSEIVPVDGAQVAGPLPGEFAFMTVLSAAIEAGDQSTEAAQQFIHFLAGPAAAAVLKAKGFEPL